MSNLLNIFRKEKKPKIKFYSLCPEVEAIAPIVSAKKFRTELLLNATKEYAEEKHKKDFGTEVYLTTAKCPGIYDLARQGWVLTTWQDIVIETNGDGTTFKWSTPTDQKVLTNGDLVGEMVDFHGRDQYFDYLPSVTTNSNTLDCVLKIQTPWRAIIPKGYYLREGHLPYAHEQRFTTLEGVYDCDTQHPTLNIQMLWHVMDGKTLIKAGTPIAHYTLMPKTQFELEVSVATPEQVILERTTSSLVHSTYVTDTKRRNCIMHNLIKRNRDGEL